MSQAIAARSIRWPQVFWGGLIVGAADIAFATTLWFTWDAAGVQRVFQTIAVGVLGKASFDAGLSSAVLGAVLQVLMASIFVLIYTLAARRNPALLRRPLVLGPLYGIALYVVMNFVVMPLSRVGASPSFKHPEFILAAVVAHMVFGVICVAFARRALGKSNVQA